MKAIFAASRGGISHAEMSILRQQSVLRGRMRCCKPAAKGDRLYG
ncbi:hypothetical protein QT971_03960 [Microcoleus sp. herbarium19]